MVRGRKFDNPEVRQPESSTLSNFWAVDLQSVEDRKFDKHYYLFSLIEGINAGDARLTTDQKFD